MLANISCLVSRAARNDFEHPAELTISPYFAEDSSIVDSIDVSGNGADVVRTAPNEIIVTMPNGGHVRIVSESPIDLFVQPEGRRPK